MRGFSSPTSICSTYNESASGCFSTETIFPTRKSNRLISVAVLAAALAGFSIRKTNLIEEFSVFQSD